ncbi:MAG TPA: NAD(P)/FAD-dependent oxidoreductase [Bryobacteraceae bacterium]|nr:NAD(P)/FAD-dependent oxidoreductase [Bryobacteraceae bacterium]
MAEKAESYDAIIAGGGPAGLATAETLARLGCSALVLEQNHEIGSPIRTSGGSFIDELDALGIPRGLHHPISRVRFVSPANAATYDYVQPRMCVMDVRGVFQFLAGRAVDAGASVRVGTKVEGPVFQYEKVAGVRTRDAVLGARVVIDATGYRSVLLKQAGLDPGMRRFGVGAEYDMYAPHCDEREAVLLVGGEFAPSGYAWVFPWGRHRVRVGVGIIHPDSDAKPDAYLDALVAGAGRFGVDLRGAQPLEHHAGLIPSECFAAKFAGHGILGVGDAAGQASSLLGEGIRWAIHAGKMAGEVAAGAIAKGDVSRGVLADFERQWMKRYGKDLRLAHKINLRIAGWDDRKWDERLEVLKLLTPDQFVEALKTNLTGGWLLRFLARNPRALAEAAGIL